MKEFLVQPGAKLDLNRRDPNDTSAFPGLSKEASGAQLDLIRQRLKQLQSMLIAQRKHKLLVIFQAMDAGGKDGTVRHVFSGLDPHGMRVVAFKAPTPAELERDFLWRVHAHAPGRGEITIFNRSHYEDVVAVRVRKLVAKEVWEKRFEHIVNFERLLSDEGTTIVKFFLHIDENEQKERLNGRLKDPTKQWKLLPSDLEDRAQWGDFTKAYEEAINRTHTVHAPWYVIPSNKKWFRNIAVAAVLRDVLSGLKLEYPPLHPALRSIESL